MKLYYKNYNEYPVDIPELSILLRDDDIYHLESNYTNYPIPYCLEIDGITRICLNEDGYFDFSKFRGNELVTIPCIRRWSFGFPSC